MLKLQMLSRRFESVEVDDLFKLCEKAKRPVNHFSQRYKTVVDFQSLHFFLDGTLICDISGPAVEDLKFQVKLDGKGYLFKMSVGELNEETLDTMNRALKGLLGRLKEKQKNKKLPGFSTDHLEGIYLWGINPDDEALEVFQEAVDIGQMSDDFRNLCIKYNISVKKFPEK